MEVMSRGAGPASMPMAPQAGLRKKPVPGADEPFAKAAPNTPVASNKSAKKINCMDMTDNFDHILLFKTNINCAGDKQLLHGILDNNKDVIKWTIDLEDEDCVLRIISHTLTHQQVIELINNNGFTCCELT